MHCLVNMCAQVVNGKERVTPELAACYSRLFTTLTQQEWTDKVGGRRTGGSAVVCL